MSAFISIASPSASPDPGEGQVVCAVLPSASDLEQEQARGLTLQAAAGDAAATRRLLELVAPAVLRSVRLVLGSKSSDIEDVTQQTLMVFVQALATFRGECHPVGYASRIAVYTALSCRRRAARLRLVPCGDDELAAATDRPRGAHDEAGTAAYQRRCVRDLLDQLPADQAEVMALHVVLGYSLAEVAEATSAPLGTVKSRLRLAKQALRRRLDEACR